MDQTDKLERVEVHNAWTIYGMNPDGTEAEEKVAQLSRPQDWGHPRWKYFHFRFEWLSDKHYINDCHCWTDVEIKNSDAPKFFSGLIVMILMPGSPLETCDRSHLAIEDFWAMEWGPEPPLWDGDEIDLDEFEEVEWEDDGEWDDEDEPAPDDEEDDFDELRWREDMA